jgi:hypothetical protein
MGEDAGSANDGRSRATARTTMRSGRSACIYSNTSKGDAGPRRPKTLCIWLLRWLLAVHGSWLEWQATKSSWGRLLGPLLLGMICLGRKDWILGFPWD